MHRGVRSATSCGIPKRARPSAPTRAMATLVVPSAAASARPTACSTRSNAGNGRLASAIPPRGIGRRALSRLRPNRAFVSPSPGSGADERRWRRASHPTEPTGAERATRVVPAAKDNAKDRPTPEDVTKKWGLEAGLWNVFRSPASETGESKMDSAKKLLKRYGSAYLVTSISLSLVSITACYALISAGVDVPGLLEHVGLTVTTTSEKFGTFALAYAAHKAASPIRFPPTVALTPVVAGWMGKEPVEEDAEDDAEKSE